ncbi:hypothetical protein BLNAU_6161 [Blattamonas nauphoetae]|uniref:Uncharacterized protein n=1 Tax=Blattamonas nauphoetae TaxID=2049346 RepID=A0ABQ9Y591_9EUKA|nr:hypothetical protein BLNAU_6161 [Blattamonas nauphoetae]
MESLSTLQRILFFDAPLLKTTDQLVTTAINKVPLLGQHASIVELNSFTLAHPSNDRIYHIRSIHLEDHPSREALLKRGYGDMHSTISSKKLTAANDAEARTLDALSPRLCQSTRMIIRQATTFRIMKLSSLTTISSIAQKETRMKVVCHCDPHTTDSRYTSCEHHIVSGHCAETEESHHLQQLALLRTRNAARPRTHSNHRASAVGCNDRTDVTFNMNATGNNPTDSDVTISKSLHFDSISHTAQNAFLPQMMHILSRFSADSLLTRLVASKPDQPTACYAMTEPSCADLAAGTLIHQSTDDSSQGHMTCETSWDSSNISSLLEVLQCDDEDIIVDTLQELQKVASDEDRIMSAFDCVVGSTPSPAVLTTLARISLFPHPKSASESLHSLRMIIEQDPNAFTLLPSPIFPSSSPLQQYSGLDYLAALSKKARILFSEFQSHLPQYAQLANDDRAIIANSLDFCSTSCSMPLCLVDAHPQIEVCFVSLLHFSPLLINSG